MLVLVYKPSMCLAMNAIIQVGNTCYLCVCVCFDKVSEVFVSYLLQAFLALAKDIKNKMDRKNVSLTPGMVCMCV